MQRPEVIALIRGNEERIKLIAAWPAARSEEDTMEDTLVMWARASGVSHRKTELHAKVLLGNDIVLMDGTICEEAAALLDKKASAVMGSVAEKEEG